MSRVIVRAPNATLARVLASQSSTFTVYPVATFASGTIYPSNTWNLAVITNALPPGGIWTGWL